MASAGSRALSGGIKKAPPMSPLQGALLDPIDIEQAFREQPGAVRLHEAIEVAKGRDHQLAAVAVDRDGGQDNKLAQSPGCPSAKI